VPVPQSAPPLRRRNGKATRQEEEEEIALHRLPWRTASSLKNPLNPVAVPRKKKKKKKERDRRQRHTTTTIATKRSNSCTLRIFKENCGEEVTCEK
jgi:hypothetical protein